jgi:tRNA-specific 2-thiouridylase
VRRLAKKFKLLTADKKDSQGICFLGKVTLVDFLKEYIPEKRGAILNIAGQKIGEHRGAYFYTIGQRQGLGVGGLRQPHYVVAKNVKKNTIILTESRDKELLKEEVIVKDVHFIHPQLKIENCKLKILTRVRYRQPLAQAVLYLTTSNVVRLVFDQPQKFVAAGQSAVFYTKKGTLIGGGVISILT